MTGSVWSLRWSSRRWCLSTANCSPRTCSFRPPTVCCALGGPLFLTFCVLFLPISLVLWLLGRGLQYVVGEAPEQLQVSLARQELQRVFDEGHQVGILRPAQRRWPQDMLSLANSPVERFCTPLGRMPSVPLGSPKQNAYRLARGDTPSSLLVTEAQGRRVVGYVRILDLRLATGETIESSRQLLEVPRSESPISRADADAERAGTGWRAWSTNRTERWA